MKKSITILFTLILSMSSYSQTLETISKELSQTKKDIAAQKTESIKFNKEVDRLNTIIAKQFKVIDSLRNQVAENTTNIETKAKDLGVKIINNQTQSEQKITEVNNLLSKNTLYWIIAILITALLSSVAYFLLNKKQNSLVQMQATDKSEVIDEISKTKKSLEEEGIKLDTKLTEILETQIKLASFKDKNDSESINNDNHTFFIKVADEITRIQQWTRIVGQDTKGLKALISSLNRIKNDFEINGYEIVDMLGKKWNRGDNLTVVSVIPDENLKVGEEIISRIIKPQVNYKGVMIQSAQVEVSLGE